jgi:hypothetical protein
MRTFNSQRFSLIALAGIYLLGLLGIIASGGSSNYPSDDDDTGVTSISLGNAIENVELKAGQPTEVKFTFTFPGDITAVGGHSLNVTSTLDNVSLSANPAPRGANVGVNLKMLAKLLIAEAFAAETAQVTAHISHAGDPNVCTSSNTFGPYTVAGAIGEALTSPTKSVSPSQQAVNIMNTGSVEVCFITTSPIDAYLSISGVAVDIEPCAEPSVNIEGGTSWSGTYECDNFGIPDNPPGTPISLTINQNEDGSYTYIDDSGASFDGHLCGNKLQYNGGVPMEYTESGTLIFSSDTQATKTSTWNSVPPGEVGGSCSDTLSRM